MGLHVHECLDVEALAELAHIVQLCQQLIYPRPGLLILLTQRHVIVPLDGEQNFFVTVRHDVPVENAEGQWCKASEECVVQVDVEVVEEGHCAETTVVSKDELRHRHHTVFVEKVEDELGDG